MLEAIGKRVVHGKPRGAELCNNVLSGAMIVTAETPALEAANGIDSCMLSEIMRTSSGASYPLEDYNRGPGIVSNAPSSNSDTGGFRHAKQLAAWMQVRATTCGPCLRSLRADSAKLDYAVSSLWR